MKKNIRHFFILTALAAGTVHFVNRFIDIAAEMKNILKSENGNYYDWKNGQIYYTKRGTGSPLLLIHDFNPVSSSYEWNRMIKKLEKEHTVYAIDLLGCGRSEKPYLTYTNYLYVQLISDFIKNIIKEKTDVVATGNSISFVILTSSMNPELINKIIAINPPAVGDFNHTPDKYSSVKKTLQELPIVGTFIYNVRMHEKVIQKNFREKYFAKPQLVSSKMLDAYFEASHMDHSHGKYLMASIDGSYTDNAISHAVKKIEKPFAIISSRNLAHQTANTETYIRLNSKIETSVISNAKQLPQLEVPDRLYELIRMFLNE
jgi:pimeloyl-ACP methyl ester carboxylesterase